MLNKTNNKPIEIGILEMSSQNRAILEFFFGGSGKSLFKEVNPERASAFIIDFDYPDAKENWEKTYNATHKPGIIISIREVTLPSAIWISKPLTSHDLTEAALKIKELLQNKNTPEPAIAIEEVSTPIKEESVAQVLSKVKNKTPERIEAKENSGVTAVAEVSDSHDSEIDALLKSLMADNASHGIHQEDSNDTDNTDITKAAKEEKVLGLPVLNANEDTDEGYSNQQESIKTAPNTAIEPLNEPIEFSLEELPKEQTIEVEEAPKPLDSASSTLEASKVASIEALNTEATPKTKSKLYVVEDEKSSADLELFEPSPKEIPSTNTVVDELDNSIEDFTSIEDFVVEDIIQDTAEEIVIDEKSLSASTAPTTHSVILDQKTVAPKKPDIINDSKSPDDELQSLLEEIRQEAETDPSAGTGNATKRFNTVAEKRWFLTCGDIKNTTTNTKENIFKTDDQILSTFLHVLEQSKISKKVMRLKFKGVIIVIDTEVDSIYSDISVMDDDFAQICFEAIEKDKIKIHSLDESEVRLYRKKMTVNPENAHSTESFIWTMSLLSSRGRLPEGTNVNQTLGLKYWPNLTRIEPIPHMMQISAVLKKHSGSLLEISKWLNIPQAYVFAYYNAVSALDLIENDQKKLNSLKSISHSSGKEKTRGLFSRLLKRITK